MSRWRLWRRGAERRRPEMMTCDEVAQVLQGYLDGELDEVAARRVALHLEDCRRCGLEASVYWEIKNSLARRGRPAPEAVARLRAFGESLLEDGDGGTPGRDRGEGPAASA